MHSIYVADESLIPEIEINLKKPHRIAHYLWVRDLGLFWSLWIDTKQLHFFFSSHRRRKWTLAKAKNFCRWRRANCWAEKKKLKNRFRFLFFEVLGIKRIAAGAAKTSYLHYSHFTVKAMCLVLLAFDEWGKFFTDWVAPSFGEMKHNLIEFITWPYGHVFLVNQVLDSVGFLSFP